ncbi:hypothetical protein Tco_0333225 [Tanacetum coccineum]
MPLRADIRYKAPSSLDDNRPAYFCGGTIASSPLSLILFSDLRERVCEAFFHLELEINYVGMKDFDNFVCRAFQVDFRAEASCFRWDGQIRYGNDQAGIGKADGLGLVSVIVQAIYSGEATVFKELEAAVLVD